MKSKFQFYKNLIFAVASALTLIAVTFAWFSTSEKGLIPSIDSAVQSSIFQVNFYKGDDMNNYTPLEGDIELEQFSAGSYDKYRISVDTTKENPILLGLRIDNIPSTMPAALRQSICIKYKLVTATKTDDGFGNFIYTDGTIISQSTGYVPISTLSNGLIFSGQSLETYQNANINCFLLYYEIGLSGDSPSTIEGLSSSIGAVNVFAQPVS